uniref:Uncharacterized protein n=1 Tax=Romanomermis culicivorax TaxID=13658 RepID=A0A915KK03_ROMCU
MPANNEVRLKGSKAIPLLEFQCGNGTKTTNFYTITVGGVSTAARGRQLGPKDSPVSVLYSVGGGVRLEKYQ